MASSSTSQYQTTTGQQAGTSTTQAQAPATTAEENLAAVPGLSSLTSLINSINQGAQQQANVSRIPGGAQLQAQGAADISSKLSGQLPPDVLALLQRQGGEMGVMQGTGPGSPAANTGLLRALGLTSLDLTNQGQSALSAALASNPSAPIFNPASGLLSPSQAGSTTSTSGTQQGTTQGTTDTESQTPGSPGGPGPAPESIPGADQWWNSLFPDATTGTGGTSWFSRMAPTATSPTDYWSQSLDLMGNPVAGGAPTQDYWTQPLDVMGDASYNPFSDYGGGGTDQTAALSTGTEGVDVAG